MLFRKATVLDESKRVGCATWTDIASHAALRSLHSGVAEFRPLTLAPLAHAPFPNVHSPPLESALRVQSSASKPFELQPRASQHHTAALRFADRCLALADSAVANQNEPSLRHPPLVTPLTCPALHAVEPQNLKRSSLPNTCPPLYCCFARTFSLRPIHLLQRDHSQLALHMFSFRILTIRKGRVVRPVH
jgi:hypothetical protein